MSWAGLQSDYYQLSFLLVKILTVLRRSNDNTLALSLNKRGKTQVSLCSQRHATTGTVIATFYSKLRPKQIAKGRICRHHVLQKVMTLSVWPGGPLYSYHMSLQDQYVLIIFVYIHSSSDPLE